MEQNGLAENLKSAYKSNVVKSKRNDCQWKQWMSSMGRKSAVVCKWSEKAKWMSIEVKVYSQYL